MPSAPSLSLNMGLLRKAFTMMSHTTSLSMDQSPHETIGTPLAHFIPWVMCSPQPSAHSLHKPLNLYGKNGASYPYLSLNKPQPSNKSHKTLHSHNQAAPLQLSKPRTFTSFIPLQMNKSYLKQHPMNFNSSYTHFTQCLVPYDWIHFMLSLIMTHKIHSSLHPYYP